MKTALKGVPQHQHPMPAGLTAIAINPATGKLLPDDAPDALREVVQSDHLPPPDDGTSPYGNPEDGSSDIF